MRTVGRIRRTVTATALMGLVALPAIGVAQNPPTAGLTQPAGQGAGDVVSVGPFLHMVADIERSVAFYTALLGVQPNDEARNWPYWRPFKFVEHIDVMYNTPGGKFRNTTFSVPNSGLMLEFFDWEGNKTPPVNARVFDPGAPMLVLQVRRIEAAVDAVTQSGGSFVTPDGQPVRVGNRRFMIVRDPDGFFIHLTDQDQALPPAPEPGNVMDATLRYTAIDANRSAQFFEAAFGFTAYKAGDFSDDPVLGKTMGLGTLRQRMAAGTVPSHPRGIQVVEYDGKLEGKKVDQALPRPGTSMLRLRVRDFDASLAKAKAAGATLAPGNDAPTPLGNGARMIVVVNPDGLPLQIAGPAPTPAR